MPRRPCVKPRPSNTRKLMSNKKPTQNHIAEQFVEKFLSQYLKNGMGSMSKADVDALVMHLLDNYISNNAGVSLQQYSNQTLSETLRTPVAKIKKLRYEAGLKYGARVEDEAKKRFSASLSNAVFDINSGKVNLIIEDSLAKNWLQGQLKNYGQYFENTFNTEVVSLTPEGLFRVLRILLPNEDVDAFESKFNDLAKDKNREKVIKGFADLAKSFAKGAVEKIGGVAVSFIPLAL